MTYKKSNLVHLARALYDIRMKLSIDVNAKEILRLLWQHKALSRWELHELTNNTPNQVGNDVAELIKQGFLRQRVPDIVGPGRPRVPLEIDPSRRYVLGVAIRPGHVELARLNLRGETLDHPLQSKPVISNAVVPTACELIRANISSGCVAIGLSTPGFVDSDHRQIISSSAVAGEGPVELEPLYTAAVGVPITLENDMHALAARWLLTNEDSGREDVILVFIEDGQLGAAVLVNGQPNRGCVVGANDLGHTRFFTKTEKCFCGRYGCLERICSTPFLSGIDGKTQSLLERVKTLRHWPEALALRKMTRYLAVGMANAANFMHPDRMVLVSPFTRYPLFRDALIGLVRRNLLTGLVDRIDFDVWEQPSTEHAETAGWLALVALYRDGWNRVSPVAAEITEIPRTKPKYRRPAG